MFPGRFIADNLNKAKNLCSKAIGEKMKVRTTLQVYQHFDWICALTAN